MKRGALAVVVVADAASAEAQAERDDKGNCLTMKCLADQMEADRLAREREYARRISENERAARQKTPDGKHATAGNPLDEHLRENCRNGLYYGTSSKVDCDDIATLRKQWERYQQDLESGRTMRDMHPERYR